MTGVKLGDLLAERVSTEVHVGGSVVKLTYRAFWGGFSEEEFASIKDLPGREYFARLFQAQEVSWDLVDDDGTPVPITAEAFEQHQIPAVFLRMCSNTMISDLLAGKVSANGSHGG